MIAEQISTQRLVQLKRDNYNLQLERTVVASDSDKLYKIIDGQIVANAGFIFLDPVTNNGRAPFYSSVKNIGNLKIPTLWFNLGILLIMSIFIALCLLYRFTARE